MFDRAGLKTAAKMRVQQNRWMAVLVCLVTTLIGGLGSSGGGFSLNFNFDDFNFNSAHYGQFHNDGFNSVPFPDSSYDSLMADLEKVLPFIIGILVVGLIAILIGIAFNVLVINVILVGFDAWFLDYSRGANPAFDVLFSRFNHFKKTVLGMLLRDVYIFLWSLLFIIPGIIKAYAYALVPYILYENPSLSAKQAVRISETMMDGWKWEMFVFELSFIGWHFLNLFTCGILGILHVNPYYYTARAMLYDNIKYHAVYERGVIDPSLLNMPTSPWQAEADAVE